MGIVELLSEGKQPANGRYKIFDFLLLAYTKAILGID